MSIKLKLTVLFLTIAIIPILFIGVFVFSKAESSLTQKTLEGLNILAQGKEAEILQYLNSKKMRAIDFASDGYIRDLAEKFTSVKSIEDKKRLAEDLNTHLKENKKPLDPDILEIHVLDLKGHIIGTTDVEELYDDIDKNKQYFSRGKEATYIQDVQSYVREGVEQGSIAIGTPLKSRTNNKVVGVLMNRYNFINIIDILTGDRAIQLGAPKTFDITGNSIDIFLVNKESSMIMSLNKMVDFKIFRHKMNTDPILKCLKEGIEINKGWLDHRGINVLGASTCMQIEQDWKWALVIEQDEVKALAPVRNLKNISVGIGTVILLLVILAAMSTSQSISKPIRDLQKGTEIIGSGNLDYKVGTITGDEIGQLSRSFDRMTGKLRELTVSRDKLVVEINERQEAEAALRESKERYRVLFDSGKDAIFVYQPTKGVPSNFIEVNNVACERLGYTREELLELTPMDIVDPELEIDVPDIMKKIFDRKQLIFEAIHVTKYGRKFPVEINTTLFKFDGKPTTLSIVRDITGRKQVEKALKEREEKYRNLFANAEVGMYRSKLDGSAFLDVNDKFAKILGYTRDELLEIPSRVLWSNTEERDKLVELIKVRGFLIDYEAQALTKSGEIKTLLVSVKLYLEEEYLEGSIQDVTESIEARKKIEEALKDAKQGERVKSLFMANMSHEIRTPLNAILGFTDLLETSTRPFIGEEEKGFFNTIRESGNRLMETVHEVLDISQIEAGTYDLKKERLDLADLVRNLVRECQPMSDKKELKLKYDSEIDSAFIRGDQYGVTQAISNIIDNAIKYTEQGEITVLLKRISEKYVLTIRDTGIGIAEEYLENMFDAFSQESEGYTKKFQGIGLGMAIAKRHLDMNHVGITVDSTKNVGTTVTMTFNPIKKRLSEMQVEKEEVKVKPTAEPVEKQLVLLVEDDPNSQRLVEFFLKKKYDMSFAVSVNEAKQQLKKSPVDLILLDLSLVGEEDGLDLVRWMRMTETWQKTPVIATTAHAFTKDQDNCLSAGCNDYLSKPIKRNKLLEKISALV